MTTKDIYQHKEKLRELFEKKITHIYTEYHCFEDAQKEFKYYLNNNNIHLLDDNRRQDTIFQEAWNNWVYGETSENFPESVVVVIDRRSKSRDKSYGYDYLIVPPELASAILTLGELPP